MDRKKKVSYSYFELNKDKYDTHISNQLIISGKSKTVIFPHKLVGDLKFLFGIQNTIPYLIEWIINVKKINIPENTTFFYRYSDWLRQSGLSWTEILLMEGVKNSLKWVYKNNQILEIDNSTSLGNTTKGKHGISPERALILQ